MVVIAKVKAMISEVIIHTNKDQVQKNAQLAKTIINFLNAKYFQELRAVDISDRNVVVLEINKMVERNMYRKQEESKLEEIRESMTYFNSNFDKRIRVGLPKCWD